MTKSSQEPFIFENNKIFIVFLSLLGVILAVYLSYKNKPIEIQDGQFLITPTELINTINNSIKNEQCPKIATNPTRENSYDPNAEKGTITDEYEIFNDFTMEINRSDNGNINKVSFMFFSRGDNDVLGLSIAYMNLISDLLDKSLNRKEFTEKFADSFERLTYEEIVDFSSQECEFRFISIRNSLFYSIKPKVSVFDKI